MNVIPIRYVSGRAFLFHNIARLATETTVIVFVSYRTGKGVATNQAESVKWYRKAAAQGHARAQYNMGRKYRIGEGVRQNYAEAAKWYRKAADKNHAKA